VESAVVSLIRDAYEAMNTGRLEPIVDRLPPDFELRPPPQAAVAGESFVGPEGIAAFRAQLADAWESMETEIEEVVDLGNRVVVLGRIHNRGRTSGLEVDAVAAHLWTIEDGVPVRIELIGDRDEALRRGRAESSAG
jgi:ketosteroid isomerase-like protein